MIGRTIHIEEPGLEFGNGNVTADPRDGLVLFGPYKSRSGDTIKAGVIGTRRGIDAYRAFVQRINEPLMSEKWNKGKKAFESDEVQRPSFPGFHAVFGLKWKPEPDLLIELDYAKILELLQGNKVKRQRSSAVVDHYLREIVKRTKSEDVSVDIWFVLVPKKIWEHCRHDSWGARVSKGTLQFMEESKYGQTSMFADDKEYLSELERFIDSSEDFHHLFKARMIEEKIDAPAQIMVEPKLEFRDLHKNVPIAPNMKAHMAWTISTTVHYKLGALPWRLAATRDGVCYLGLVYKKLKDQENSSVASAAQMFLKDGDGAVFRGNIGLWETRPNEFHLNKASARDMVAMALEDYREKWPDYPDELFIHGKAEFGDEEWAGFEEARDELRAKTRLVGVVIKDKAPLKLMRVAEGQANHYGLMRGTAWVINEREAYLNTRGFVPRLSTALNLEIPNLLYVKISKGQADIETVLKDIMDLTKLNYNACVHADGKPVTLSFSNVIGNVLTATGTRKSDVRQFKYYI